MPPYRWHFLLITFGKIVANKLSYVDFLYYIYTVTFKQEQMTKQEFNSKYRVEADLDDVLTIIAANLSDVQHMLEFDQNLEANKRLNSIKGFIFDFRKLDRLERLAEMRGQLETV